jgi:hypothetical protein
MSAVAAPNPHVKVLSIGCMNFQLDLLNGSVRSIFIQVKLVSKNEQLKARLPVMAEEDSHFGAHAELC